MASLLEDLASRDPHRVWSSSCAIAKLRDPEQLKQLAEQVELIKQATEGLELGGMVFSNSGHLDFAIQKLEFVKAGSGCLCALYPSYLFFDPKKEAASDNVTLEPSDNEWDSICTCSVCGRRFYVKEGEYHYTWWQWEAI